MTKPTNHKKRGKYRVSNEEDFERFVQVTADSATAQEAAVALGLTLEQYRVKAYQLRQRGVKNLKRFPRKRRVDYGKLDELAKKLSSK